MNALPWIELRLAIRRLRKDAGTTIAAVGALACAIGAGVATWSLISAVLLEPLALEAADVLFQIDEPPPPNVTEQWVPGHTYADFEAFRDSDTFEAIAAGGLQHMLVVEQGDVPQTRAIYFSDHDFFGTLGIGAARGRTFTEDDDQRGAPAVAVLSDHYWRRVFDADPSVLGRTVAVSGTTATIVGVLPRGFRGLHLSQAPDLYLPLHITEDIDYQIFNRFGPLGRRMPWLSIVGRMRSGETPAAATAQLNTLDCQCPQERSRGETFPIALTNVNIAAVPELARGRNGQFATLLSITVGLLLLVGSLTVGMLLLVRTEDRRDELTVRLALGATRKRLALGIAVEAATLCALAAVVAVPVALWLFLGIRAFHLPGSIDIERLELALLPGAWLTVAGAALSATCMIALLSSLVGVGLAARSPVQSRALATPRVTRRAPRTVLVAGQVAITLVLVTGAGLFTRSLLEALSLNPGVETGRIVTTYFDLAQHGYTPAQAELFGDEMRQRLRQNGTIASASIMRVMGGRLPGLAVPVDGVPREMPSGLSYAAADDTFFSTLGLPVISGRSFEQSDGPGAPRVAVVSESLGRLIADGGNPIGQRIADMETAGLAEIGQTTYLEIIGMVPDLITEVSTTKPLVVYQPLAQQRPIVAPSFFVRAAGDTRAAMRQIGATARALDDRVTPQDMMTLDEQIGQQMNSQRFGIYVLGGLGGMALLLTVLGTYVVAESMVVRRRRELGIRAALGARSTQLRALVLRDTGRLIGIGLIAGLALAVAGARLIRSLLYQVEPLDPLVLITTAGTILGLALLVSLRPALEATRVDLNRTLREE